MGYQPPRPKGPPTVRDIARMEAEQEQRELRTRVFLEHRHRDDDVSQSVIRSLVSVDVRYEGIP